LALKFDQSLLRLQIQAPLKLLKIKNSSIGYNLPKWAHGALEPNNVSFYLNTELTQEYQHNETYKPNFKGNWDYALNIHQYVFEGDFTYDNNKSQLRSLENRLIHDVTDKKIRYTLGDLSYKTKNNQNFLNLSGFGLEKNFSLTPYDVVTPLSNREFVLKEKSHIKVFINDRLIKSLILSAGRHQLEDLPLTNGINEIKLDITTFSGDKDTLTFREGSSDQLLKKGEVEYTVQAGVPYQETINHRKYSPDSKNVGSSSFFSYGAKQNYTVSTGFQNWGSRYLVDLSQIVATGAGNFTSVISHSSHPNFDPGFKHELRFLRQSYSGSYGLNRLALSWDYQNKNFGAINASQPSSSFLHRYRMSYGRSFFSSFFTTMGVSYEIPRNQLYHAYGASLNFSKSWSAKWTSNFSVNRGRKSSGLWETSAYAFINIAFDGGHYSTFSADTPTRSQKIDYNYSARKNYRGLNARVSAENNEEYTEEDLYFDYASRYVDINWQHSWNQYKNGGNNTGNGQLRVSQAIAYTGGRLAFTRPIRNSFALVTSTNPKLEVQTSDDHSDVIGRVGYVHSDLTPYRYEQIAINPNSLVPGQLLEQESFPIFPRYRSGHLIEFNSEQRHILIASLIDSLGKPVSLRTGHLKAVGSTAQPIPFFTNRKGRFYIEHLTPGNYLVVIDGINEEQGISISVDKNSPAIVKLGKLVVN
jgi:outer membrane usher protein FimD/PapC